MRSVHFKSLDSPLLLLLAECVLPSPLGTLTISARHLDFSGLHVTAWLRLLNARANAGLFRQIQIKSSSPLALQLAQEFACVSFLPACQHCAKAVTETRIVCICGYYTCTGCLLARCKACGLGICDICAWDPQCSSCAAFLCDDCAYACFYCCTNLCAGCVCPLPHCQVDLHYDSDDDA